MTDSRRILRSAVLALGLAVVLAPGAGRAAESETIAFIRHGEKPARGLGQLDCQGLNRALALPPVLVRLFGTPAAIFAPDPAHQKIDEGTSYDYVRPLATIEPTAIALGLPVHADLGVDDIAGLQTALEQPALRGGTVLVAWEHRLIEEVAKNLLAAHGADPSVVPKWDYDDYDGIYVVHLAWTAGAATATFERGRQGLDGQTASCPR
jgi:hypothetical protein